MCISSECSAGTAAVWPFVLILQDSFLFFKKRDRTEQHSQKSVEAQFGDFSIIVATFIRLFDSVSGDVQ